MDELEDVKKLLGDKVSADDINGKVKEGTSLKDLQEMVENDRELIPAALAEINKDQAARKNLQRTANNHLRIQANHHSPSSSERKDLEKAQRKNDRYDAEARFKASLSDGEKKCICVSPSGGVSTTVIKGNKQEVDEKYVTNQAYIGGEPFYLLSEKGNIGAKKNTLATTLLNTYIGEIPVTCYGHIFFVALKLKGAGPECDWKHIAERDFKKLVKEELNSRK